MIKNWLSKKIDINEKIKDELTQRAQKDAWLFTFDRDEDAFFYSPQIIPDGAELFNVNGEFSVYLDKQKNLCGVVLEYSRHNFIEHHQEFKETFEKFFEKDAKDDVKIIDPNRSPNNEMKMFQKLFERTLIAEAAGARIHI